MSNPSDKDTGVLYVLLQRLEHQRLPRALELKEKVDKGELLSDYDLAFLQEVFADAGKVKQFIDQHPDYEELVTRLISLYQEITDKALQNEKAGKP